MVDKLLYWELNGNFTNMNVIRLTGGYEGEGLAYVEPPLTEEIYVPIAPNLPPWYDPFGLGIDNGEDGEGDGEAEEEEEEVECDPNVDPTCEIVEKTLEEKR